MSHQTKLTLYLVKADSMTQRIKMRQSDDISELRKTIETHFESLKHINYKMITSDQDSDTEYELKDTEDLYNKQKIFIRVEQNDDEERKSKLTFKKQKRKYITKTTVEDTKIKQEESYA